MFYQSWSIEEFGCSVVTSSKGQILKKLTDNDQPKTDSGYKLTNAAYLISVQSNHFIWLNLNLLQHSKLFSVQVYCISILYP